ncbi:DUF4157 domain-containing protein [Streptomyces sp. JV176]|uniref:eCIS core domain-containing protein n=1 Tax=Streptomyces sp. JV176 TaxID=858630 RepID=UPI002E75CF8B|nr:DUF4157 domain-containing protein [Streptomyces sp. JV176]MEE1803290.1 DUF4157 domain-containing protein [Streptomyces sp. JV176]
MSARSASAASQEARSAQEAKRRKRKERAAASRTPEPKDIVSGAGQPLDLSVRRELEEQLGHDFSRVRLHTDRDAGTLTDLLGADAVAVGQDIFFREGAYRPGTADGQRLLAHELLHTVQNPDGLGALRAGRGLGAVSLPQEAMEREAESTAQALVRPETADAEQPAPQVEKGQATPGWLRYATADADRRRMEELDPATLVDRLANGVMRSLRGDPEDRSGRARLQLARMAPTVQESVLDRLEVRLPAPALDRLLDLVDETEQQGPLPLRAAGAPLAVPGEAEEVARERERAAGEGRGEQAEDTGDGGREPGPRGENGKPADGGGTTDPPSGRGGADDAGASTASPEQAAAQDRDEAAARQQDRSQAQQEDRDASGAQDASKDDAGAQEEQEAEEPAEEAAQEPEPQAAAEEPRQAEEQSGGPTVKGDATAGPAAVDRSGAEPGEKARTGGDPATARTAGDPENEEDTDDEPLGLESESAEEEPASDEDSADSGARGSGGEPTEPDTADDPRLFRRRKRGEPREPGISSTEGDAEPDTPQDVAETEESPAPERTDEEDTEDRTLQELSDVMSGERDLGPESGPGASASPGSGATVADTSDRDWATRQTEEGREDSEAQRRDAEARTADSTAQAPVGGEQAAPEQLAKADEDARTQGAASSSAAGASTESRAEGAGKPETARSGGTAGRSEPEQATGAGTNAEQASGKAEDAGGQGSGPDQDAPSPTPTPTQAPGPAEQDVTEGKGPDTSAGPVTGPDKVSTPGPASAPELAPGNGPTPMAGPDAKTNSPKAAGAPRSGSAGAAPRSRQTPAQRQTARKAAKTVRRGAGGGGSGRPASAPAPARGGRGGGRAGGSGSGKSKKEAPAPDVSNATPESGLATAAGLKPHQALETLKGVDGAVGRSVDKERTTLRKAPPKTRRPSGSPRTVPGGPTVSAPGAYTNAKVARTQATPGSTPEISGEQRPEGELPGSNVPEPSWWDIAVTIGAQLFGRLLKEILPLDDLIDSILGLPTKDEGLRNARVGDAPGLPLENDSDPQRTDEQSQKLDERKNELHLSGRTDAGLPMGEDQIYPDVPGETLTGKVPGGKKTAKASGPRSVSGSVPIESASAVAEHDRGPQIQAGFTEGRGKMAEERGAKDEKSQQDKEKYDRDLKREVDASGKKQSDTRDKGRSDISASRADWRQEQDDKVAEIDGKKGKKYEKVRQDITDKETETDEDVDKRTEDDNQRITDTQTDAEREAEEKQEEGKSDADNWLEEAIEKLKEFFEELKNAIKTVFEEARQFVTDVIDQFKQAVFQLIDDARNWVIDQINVFADALIALGDELLADYPAMRDKWRNTIDGARDWAVEKVNEFADALKEVAGKLLDGLCDALVAGLDLLETGLLAAVDLAETVTVGALEFGAAVVQGLGEWAAIFNDIVSDPGDWISKAGAAAETGARDHLFEEIKTAVKAWFNQKVQEIIGIPMEDFQALLDGGVTAEEMGQMAWDEALPQLPLIIGVLVVEKVVARLIPGAGWVMAVIDALQTAWGALSEILAAFGLFMDFLKSVKSGNGALPFAKAVAAGVVALLELVYQFLIEGVGRFMGKVADRLGDLLKNLRKKKPGGSDRPGQPDAPDKPENGGPARTSEDRTPSDRPSDRPAPRKPTPDQTSRPRPKPSPGKRSSPEKKPRPSHTTRPKKRRDDEERREDGREVNAARRRARDAERRTRDDDRDGPTRRGPARDTLRPDRRRPGTDRRDDRDRDRDPGSTRQGDRRPDDRRRDDDRRDDRRHDTDKDRRPGDRPRRRPLRRARQTIKSAVNRARRAARKLYGKARRKLGGSMNDRLRRLKDQLRRRRDRMQDDRSRDRRRHEDGNRRDDGRQRKPAPPRVRFRMGNAEIHTLLFGGRYANADLAVRSTEKSLHLFFREWEDELSTMPEENEKKVQERARMEAIKIWSRVEKRQDQAAPRSSSEESQERPIATRIRAGEYEQLRRLMVRLAALMSERNANEDDLPPTIFPPFADGVRAPASTKARYLKKSTPDGEEVQGETPDIPLGWKPRMRGWPDSIVRMHLLTARLGGLASGSNLVPAPSRVNTRFLKAVEDKADLEARKNDRSMIWYESRASFHPRPYQNFPSIITSSWNFYDRTDNNKWNERTAESGKTYSEPVPPPRLPGGGHTIRINDPKESKTLIKKALCRAGASYGSRYATNIIKMAKERNFTGDQDLKLRLELYERSKKDRQDLAALADVLNNIDNMPGRISYDPM